MKFQPTKIKMENKMLLKWTEEMLRLGYKYDTNFDGWGTYAGE